MKVKKCEDGKIIQNRLISQKYYESYYWLIL